MRLRVLGALALVVATAGCGTFLGDGAGAGTLTPAPVPTVESTPEDPRVAISPGVSTSGVTDPAVLAEHHVAAVREMSYVYSEAHREVSDGGVDVQSAHRIVVENETVYRRTIPSYDDWVDGDEHHLEGYGEYGDGSTLYRSWFRGDAGRVFQFDDSPGERTSYARYAVDPIERYLDVTDPTITRFDVEGSSLTYYRITGTDVSLRTKRAVEAARVRAIVRADGFVKHLDVEFDATVDDRDLAITYNFTYEEVGTATVTPPTWAEAAHTRYEKERDAERPRPTPTRTDVLEDGTGRTG